MEKVNIIEIGPRDGFQSIKEFIPTETKIDIIKGLIDANIKKIQLTSFVSAKAIPQLKDAKDVCKYFMRNEKYKDVNFFALTPNLRGVREASEVGLNHVGYVISVSESHNKANINRTVSESFEELKKIRDEYPDMRITVDVATAFGCPFEGITPIESVVKYVRKGVELGITSFDLCDTIGVATPNHVKKLLIKLKKFFKAVNFECHIHDTRNMGMLNSLTAIENGADGIQVSVGGLGGCPFAPGASGNTSSEDLVYMLNRMGYDTGIDFIKLLQVAKFAKSKIDGNFSGHQINISSDCCIY